MEGRYFTWKQVTVQPEMLFGSGRTYGSFLGGGGSGITFFDTQQKPGRVFRSRLLHPTTSYPFLIFSDRKSVV